MRTYPWTGPAIRIGVALTLCAACFQAGRWYQELAVKSDPGTQMVASTFHGEPEPAAKAEPAPLVSAGNPVGVSGDIITPLNVRDPSALVMGIGGGAYAPSPAAPPPAPAPKMKMMPPSKIKRGRLLELLRKADKNTGAPKDF